MPELRTGLQALPPQMQHLPIEERGYPVPFFADKNPNTGAPELRIMDPDKLIRCMATGLCWICGKPMKAVPRVFCLGTMGAINRINSEPPSHPDCARYAAQNCPFMARGHMARSAKADIPKTVHVDSGVDDNPGVWALYWASNYTHHFVNNGVHFYLDKPVRIEWWKAGRLANRIEVMQALVDARDKMWPDAERQGATSGVIEGVRRLNNTLPR